MAVRNIALLNKQIILERNKRKAVQNDTEGFTDRSDLVGLSHSVRGEGVFPGLLPPRITEHMSHEESRGRYASGVGFRSARSRWSPIPVLALHRSYVSRLWIWATHLAGCEHYLYRRQSLSEFAERTPIGRNATR